jgi:uncharacterized protein YjiS (DUF1127 family)
MSNLAEMNDSINIVHGSFRRNIFVRIAGKIGVWRQRRAAIRELKAMSDSLLRDLGIERYQITDVVNQTGQFAELRPAHPDHSIVVPLQQAAA